MAGTMADLLKELDSDPYETVFLIGNGVVENGSRPLMSALDEFCGETLKIDPIDMTGYIVFQTRLFSQQNTNPTEKIKEVEKLHKLKSIICSCFVRAKESGDISLRSSRDFVAELAIGKSVIVTTNWDTLLEDLYAKSERYDVISLHGNVKQPTGIYLPTETTLEPYWNADDETFLHLRAVHLIAVSIFEKAKRVVVWGHSLSVYDAEVCLLMACTRSDIAVEREFFVINPRKEPVEKLKVLTGSKKVTHIDPNEL